MMDSPVGGPNLGKDLTWVEAMAEDERNERHVQARVRALALPMLAASKAVGYACVTVAYALSSCFKLAAGVTLLSLSNDSEAVSKLLAMVAKCPGITECIQSAIKTAFCFAAIFVTLPLALISPTWNLGLYQCFGVGVTSVPKKQQEKEWELKPVLQHRGFAALIGMDELKEAALGYLLPFQNPYLAKRMGLGSPAGMLLSGPPGCGKTFFSKRLREELEDRSGKKCHFSFLSMDTVGSSYLHATAGKIGAIFKEAAESVADGDLAIVFIDEIDTLFGESKLSESRQPEEKGQLLQMLAKAPEQGIIVIAATNHPDKLSPELIRAGRFDYKIEVPLPSRDLIEAAFERGLEKVNVNKEINVQEWFERQASKELNFADVDAIIRQAKRLLLMDIVSNPMIPSVLSEVVVEAPEDVLKEKLEEKEEEKEKTRPLQLSVEMLDKAYRAVVQVKQGSSHS